MFDDISVWIIKPYLQITHNNNNTIATILYITMHLLVNLRARVRSLSLSLVAFSNCAPFIFCWKKKTFLCFLLLFIVLLIYIYIYIYSHSHSLTHSLIYIYMNEKKIVQNTNKTKYLLLILLFFLRFPTCCYCCILGKLEKKKIEQIKIYLFIVIINEWISGPI